MFGENSFVAGRRSEEGGSDLVRRASGPVAAAAGFHRVSSIYGKSSLKPQLPPSVEGAEGRGGGGHQGDRTAAPGPALADLYRPSEGGMGEGDLGGEVTAEVEDEARKSGNSEEEEEEGEGNTPLKV